MNILYNKVFFHNLLCIWQIVYHDNNPYNTWYFVDDNVIFYIHSYQLLNNYYIFICNNDGIFKIFDQHIPYKNEFCIVYKSEYNFQTLIFCIYSISSIFNLHMIYKKDILSFLIDISCISNIKHLFLDKYRKSKI